MSAKDLAVNALHANQRHQYNLAAQAKRLEDELAELDKLLPQIDIQEDEENLDCDFYIADSAPPTWPVKNFLHPDSPFHDDAAKRTRYLNFTTRHPISSAKEVDALRTAVGVEWKRVERLGNSSGTSTVDSLNWAAIAEKVSDLSSTTRTAIECKIKWIGEFSPEVRREQWSSFEVAALEGILKKIPGNAKIDWVQVAKDLGTNRLPIDCLRQGLQRPPFSWTDEMNQRMIDAVGRYGQCWALVAKHVSPAVMASQCSSHWYRALDPALHSGTWSPEEDKRLKAAVLGFGKSWVQVATAVPGRNNEQCRERWMNAFEKGSKDTEWSEEDDQKLLEAIGLLGKKWKDIGVQLGRPAKHCQLRAKELHSSGIGPQQSPSLSANSNDVVQQAQDPELEERPTVPLPRRGRKNVITTVQSDEQVPNPPPPKKPRGRSKKTTTTDTASVENPPASRPKPKPLRRGTKRAAPPEFESQPERTRPESELSEVDHETALLPDSSNVPGPS
ncbi:Myb domain protein 4r1 [Mycena indigotica]|uniref:Myb domain protein 4r1 n=1 Tax=Mycena indigotica TaxID=2126181 RepID=A0A8H6SKM4_9AGAR|nr:Myb domain protein 4r1 [Mycena indigotica]KAF7301475.1 Myb domain protein 4r1 [Mycena indigotica]